MWKLMQDCENDMCDREPHNRQTKLCIHHHTVYNLFLDSGMNRNLAEIHAKVDTSHLQTECGSCRLTGNMCNRKLARGLGLCNYHLSMCSRRARETGISLPQLVDTMEREHKEECLRLIQENERIRRNYIREARGASIAPAAEPASAAEPAPAATNSRTVRISSSEWQRRVSSETLAEARATGARRGRAQAEARNAAQVIAPESITPSPTMPAESITRNAVESAVSIARQAALAARNAVEVTRSVVESITPESITPSQTTTNNTEPRVPIIRTNNMTPSQVAGLSALRRHNIEITIPETEPEPETEPDPEPDKICSICFD